MVFSSLKQSPEDIENGAVTSKVEEVEKQAGDELCQMIMDPLADTLLEPFDMIAQGLKNMVPKAVKSAKLKFDAVVSSVPCSAILHLVLIETLTIWIFYYSVLNVFTNVIVGASKEMHSDIVWPPVEQVDKCLAEHARRLLWIDGHLSPENCFDADTVEAPYSDDEDGNPPVMGAINQGCLLLCVILWFVVLGHFFWHTSCRFWVRYNSGAYLQCTFFTRRSRQYRWVCVLLGTFAVLSIASTGILCASVGIIEWYISTQLMNLFVVLISARAFLAPTKPKFDYTNLDQLDFKRPTFFQTNGGFAVVLNDSLIQSARGAEFRGPLVRLLPKKGDWQNAMRICLAH